MATATIKPDVMEPAVISGGDVVTRIPIRPGGLDHYLAMIEEDAGWRPRIKCYDGSLVLVSPGIPHERASEQIGAIVSAICLVFDVRFRAYASSLYRRHGKDRGIEPDRSYYIANLDRVRGKTRLDFDTDPPPDLVVEVVNSHPVKEALEVCREIGVPEVWVFDVRKQKVDFLILKRRGKSDASYCASSRSRSFPYLKPADVTRWVVGQDLDDNELFSQLDQWVRDELAPRLRAPKPPKKHD